ncbi:MAG: TonB-dependent receptor [Bacteroidales bacterium]|nr:TonB-dependent receptor [Bacteroidales bacterium]
MLFLNQPIYNKMKYVFMAFLFFILINSYAQYATISGTITDKETGEFLIAANVYEPSSLTGTVSNYFGFYSLRLKTGKTKIVFSYMGYQSIEKEIELKENTIINIELDPSILLDEVVVTDKGPVQNLRSSQMSLIEIPVKNIKQIPVLLGEVDIIKSIQLMPGVQGGTEGTSGLYVRGGGPDQNLILLDGVPVYNVNHLFGLFSVFNADAIKNVTLYKGGFPARFGGRLSSVIDIRMKEGNNKEFQGVASIGLLSSSLTLEGPILKGKSSYIVSGRRSYLDILTYPVQMAINKAIDDASFFVGYFFQDFNAKINHSFSERSKLYLSTYFGKDKFFIKTKYGYSDADSHSWFSSESNGGIQWGNRTAALRWNYMLLNNLFLNVTGTYSDYQFKFFEDYKGESVYEDESYSYDYNFAYLSKIVDYGVKADFDYTPVPSHYIRFGGSTTYHLFTPGVQVYKTKGNEYEPSIDTTFGNIDLPSDELFIYIEDEVKIGEIIKINAGAHFSTFFVKGKTYKSIEPRLSGRIMINQWLSAKASYVHMTQYLHLLANSTLGLPTDLWVPVTKKITPQKARQAAAGFAVAMKDEYEITVEGFYKTMEDMIEYSEGASFFSLYGDWEDKITTGVGESYGIEFFARKSSGKTTGWIGYTLSWANRTFSEISYGKTFPYLYDRRHDISIVITHNFSENLNIGANWVFGTGYPMTLEDEKYADYYNVFDKDSYQSQWEFYPETLRKYFETRNSYRKPDYHRLDLGVNFIAQKKWWERTWSFGIYNLYMRANPFAIYPTEEFNEETKEWEPVLKQISLLQFIPYARWTIKF